MNSTLRNGFGGAVLLATVSGASAFAADANDLGLSDERDIFMRGSSVLITEKCAPKADDMICKMDIIMGSSLRVFEDREARYTNGASKGVEVTYKGAVSGNFNDVNISQAGQARFYTTSRVRYDEKLAKRYRSAADASRQIGSAEPYLQAGDNLTRIEEALKQSGAFSYGGTHRPLDGVIRLEGTRYSVSETSCKLISINGLGGKPDVELEEGNRAICVTKAYKDQSDYTVKTTISIHGLDAEGQLMSATFTDNKRMGDMPNGEYSDNDKRSARELRQILSGQPTAVIFQ